MKLQCTKLCPYHTNGVTSWLMTQFALAVTNHSADEMRSDKTSSDDVRLHLCLNYLNAAWLIGKVEAILFDIMVGG